MKKIAWFLIGFIICFFLFYFFALDTSTVKKQNTEKDIESSYCRYQGGYVDAENKCVVGERAYDLEEFYIKSLVRTDGLEKRELDLKK